DLRPQDQVATQLVTRAQADRNKAADYETAIAGAHEALSKGNYDEAERQAKRALELRPQDQTATQLVTRAQADRNKAADYETAIAGAHEALSKGNYDESLRDAIRVLDLRPQDQVATQLVTRAQGDRKQAADYETALAGARDALSKGNYDEAERQAKR